MSAHLSRAGVGIAALASLLMCSCGEQPIAAQAPLYVVVNDAGTLSLEVLNQTDYRVVGKIGIVAVGNAPPTGAVAALPDGRVLVTYTGVTVGRQVTLSPSTVACSLKTSKCDAVWSGWGSATAVALDNSSIVVPGWDNVHLTSGKLGFFGGPSLALRTEVALAHSLPGPLAVSPDGRNVYWITYAPTSDNKQPEQHLLRVDATNGNVLGDVAFGKRLPYSLAINTDGQIFVSILFDQAPGTPSDVGVPGKGVLGSTVEIFSPDLSTSRLQIVGQGPTHLAVDGTHLIVSATTLGVASLGIYDVQSGTLQQTVDLPQSWTLGSLDMIRSAGGAIAGIVELNAQSHQRFRLGVVDLSTGAVKWHEFAGEALGAVAT